LKLLQPMSLVCRIVTGVTPSIDALGDEAAKCVLICSN
jgi:hypothetical protein